MSKPNELFDQAGSEMFDLGKDMIKHDDWVDEEEIEDDNLEDDEEANIVDFPFVHHSSKVGRNEPCPCGSGKKFKRCCLN